MRTGGREVQWKVLKHIQADDRSLYSKSGCGDGDTGDERGPRGRTPWGVS